jgi:hypothetical protein
MAPNRVFLQLAAIHYGKCVSGDVQRPSSNRYDIDIFDIPEDRLFSATLYSRRDLPEFALEASIKCQLISR